MPGAWAMGWGRAMERRRVGQRWSDGAHYIIIDCCKKSLRCVCHGVIFFRKNLERKNTQTARNSARIKRGGNMVYCSECFDEIEVSDESQHVAIVCDSCQQQIDNALHRCWMLQRDRLLRMSQESSERQASIYGYDF